MSNSTKTEAALRLSEATRVAILQTALDCIVTIDHQGLVVDWNPAAENTFGFTSAEAIGREMSELIIPEKFREMHRRGLACAVTTGRDTIMGKRIEITAQRKNGEVFPVELAITRISAGAHPLFTGHIRDISERKQSENALRESQQLLASITGNITEGIFRRSHNGRLLFVNEAYAKMFGFNSAEEIMRVPVETLYADPTQRAQVLEILECEGGLRAQEIEYRRKDGSTFWGLTSAAGLRDTGAGEILFFDGAVHDITERKEAEQLQDAQYAVTRVLAESTTLAEATPRILREICERLRWDLGALWQVQHGETLRCVDVWSSHELAATDFVADSRELNPNIFA